MVIARNDEQKPYSGNLNGGSYTNNSETGVESFAISGTIDNASNIANYCSSIKGATFSIGGTGSTSNSVFISTHYQVCQDSILSASMVQWNVLLLKEDEGEDVLHNTLLL